MNVIYIEESETRAQKDEDEEQHANAFKLIFARGIPANYHFSRLDGASRIVPRSSSTFASFVIDVDSERSNPAFRGLPGISRRNRLKTAMLSLSHETGVFKRIIVEEERAGGRQTRASCVRAQPRTEGRLRPREAITYFDLRGTHRRTTDCTDSRVSRHTAGLRLPQRDCECITQPLAIQTSFACFANERQRTAKRRPPRVLLTLNVTLHSTTKI